MEKEEIIRAVLYERDQQDVKWGLPQGHYFSEWIAILGEEFGETCQEILKLTFGGVTPERLRRYVDETIQVAAVAVAMLEFLDESIALGDNNIQLDNGENGNV